jgi:hypothetical protein
MHVPIPDGGASALARRLRLHGVALCLVIYGPDGITRCACAKTLARGLPPVAIYHSLRSLGDEREATS